MARMRRSFGGIRRLPSGRYQANYTGPDTRVHNAPWTFDAKVDAEAWLADRRREITRGEWTPPGSIGEKSPMLFGEYADIWLRDRPIKPKTREFYQGVLTRRILPTFAETPMQAITPAVVRQWYGNQGDAHPTGRAHAYGLLKAILATAVSDELISSQPCRIRGASTAPRRHQIKPATLDEIAVIVDAMPPRYQAMTLLAVWTALRFGELTELRRRDVDTKTGVLHVRRAVTRVGGKPVVGTPKSSSGIRDVAIPPHLLPTLRRHILEYAEPGRDGLMFPASVGGHMPSSTLWRVFSIARQKAGRPDLRRHDLRHTSATMAATTGATIKDLMSRLSHSTPAQALAYQHAAQDADKRIAQALSAMAKAQEL